jgi:hypothetical protein
MKITRVLIVDSGDDERKKPRKGRRGWNPLIESTAQPTTKRKMALAPNIDQG